MTDQETSKDADLDSYSTEMGAEVHPADFSLLGASEPSSSSSMDLLLDVVLQVNVELGRSSLPIRDILALGPGSVVELDKLAGEPVDVFINSTLIARGEVVVVDEKFGVRVTEIVTPAKRIASLA
ncbi:MAG: flagellar motor switch protein FliN [Dehalococcoidales bacterium]|nr:flagellar motor switch protein FliN [Dehalococcoidales bacterium]